MIVYARAYYNCISPSVTVIDDDDGERAMAVLQLGEEIPVLAQCQSLRAANRGSIEKLDDGWRYRAEDFEWREEDKEEARECEIQ